MRGFIRCIVLCLAFATAAHAQIYPSRPVTIVVPFAPGSGTDSIARILGQHLATALNQSVVIENKVGASGILAATYVARAAPDGYTLLMATNSTHSANPYLFKSIGYDPVKDFAPVARAGAYVFMLVVNSALLPDLPSLHEAGIPGYDVTSWAGLFAPAGTPKEVVERLNAEVQKIIANPDAKAKIAVTGFDAFSGPPETLAAFVESELVNWGRLIKDAGIEVQ